MDKETNVIIRFTADSGGLEETNQKIAELRERNKELWADYDKTNASRKAASEGTVREVSSMKQYYDETKKATKEIESNRKSIERLEKSMKKVPEAIPAKAVEKSFKQITKELTNQINTMKMHGDTGSETLNRLQHELGELNDIAGDTQRAIKGIGSDTIAFDTVMEGTQGIAAGFQVAQGAAALFGVEEEKLMPMMVRLQAIMATTSGLQQIGNTLQKESNVMRAVHNLQLSAAAKAEAAHAMAIAAKTGAEKLSIAGTVKATVAQKAFNLVAKANPYVLLATAIISVVGAIALLTRANKEHTTGQKRMNDLGKAAIEGYNEQQVELEIMQKRINDTTTSLDEKQRMLKTVNEKYLDSNHQLKNINELEAWLVNSTPAVVEAYVARATAEAARQKAVETNMKILGEEKKSDKELLKWTDDFVASVYGLFGDAEELRSRRADYYREKNIAGLQKEKEFYIQTAIETGNKASEAYSKLGLKTGDEKDEQTTTTAPEELKYWQTDQYRQEQDAFEENLKAKRSIKEINVAQDLEIDKKQTDAILEELKRRHEEEVEMERAKEERKREIVEASVNTLQSIGGTLFSINSDRLSQELEDLDEYYTTDAEEARTNADKKYITEKELSAKKLEIKRKQAQSDKLEGIFNIGISTAIAIAKANPNVVLMALAAAVGAVQLAAVASKPLPKYWKGTKGNRGELAWVGEHGPELMWVPKGASVVPNVVSRDAMANKRYDLLQDWNIPSIYNIELPRVSKETIREVRDVQKQDSIDYDLLGKSVARYIKTGRPVKNNVSVTVDGGGVTVDDNGNRRIYKNRKYIGVWN
ncbi:hypothetical protein [Limibacterium fermenti]|uniref:hypothetical protein n=1 Tax=Limibacterium fermenti TaxID=3229863 RepID=UPI003A5D699E